MTNGYLFDQIFGLYATELWAKPEKEFLEWLNAEVKPCENCISREAALDAFNGHPEDTLYYSSARNLIRWLPSVTPEIPRGKWIEHPKLPYTPVCSCCGEEPDKAYVRSMIQTKAYYQFCPHCGAIMVEQLESEDKE